MPISSFGSPATVSLLSVSGVDRTQKKELSLPSWAGGGLPGEVDQHLCLY